MSIDAVSIVIPNYNGQPILNKSLAAVLDAARAYPGDAEVIVVDDASRDESIALISRDFPEVRLVRHRVNQGFSEAVHTGVNAARHDVVVLLNSDVWPAADFLAPLVAALADSSVFAASPLVCGPDGAALAVSWNLQKLRRGTIKSEPWSRQRAEELRAAKGPLPSVFASGGSVALKKRMFLELEGFHPLYKPFYSEDVDLCTRAWMRGWSTVFEPRSRVIHDNVGTIKRFFKASRIRRIRLRNRFLYLWIYSSRRDLYLRQMPWVLLRLVGYTLRLDFNYARALRMALAKLREVQALRAEMKSAHAYRPLHVLLAQISQHST